MAVCAFTPLRIGIAALFRSVARRFLLSATLIGALLAHLLLFLPLPLFMRALAALVLTNLLPGVLLLEWLFANSPAPPALGERILYAIGAGYALMVLVMLGVSYLPGPVASWQVYLAFDLLLGLLALLVWRQGAGGREQGARSKGRRARLFTAHCSLITHHWPRSALHRRRIFPFHTSWLFGISDG